MVLLEALFRVTGCLQLKPIIYIFLTCQKRKGKLIVNLTWWTMNHFSWFLWYVLKQLWLIFMMPCHTPRAFSTFFIWSSGFSKWAQKHNLPLLSYYFSWELTSKKLLKQTWLSPTLFLCCSRQLILDLYTYDL